MGFTSTNALEVLTSLCEFLSSQLWVCGLLGWESYQGQSNYMIQDLSRGLEKTPIPVVFSDVGLPSFQYINTSMVHDRAYVNQTLSSLCEGSYCACPAGDCLTHLVRVYVRQLPTVVALHTWQADSSRMFFSNAESMRPTTVPVTLQCYCTKLRRIESVVTCGVHKSCAFISECNAKCGCHIDCGNRVVQQGMRYGVEVFRTAHMGWGIRARVRIPRGAFVFEMTGRF